MEVELRTANTRTKTCLVSDEDTILKITCDTNDSNVRDLVATMNRSRYVIATGGSGVIISRRTQFFTLFLSGGLDYVAPN